MFILKHFKIMKNSKVARQKENDGQILLTTGFLGPKDKLRMRTKKSQNYLKNLEIKKPFENLNLTVYFKMRMME